MSNPYVTTYDYEAEESAPAAPAGPVTVTRQRFTQDGRWGVWLFICGPIVTALSALWLWHELVTPHLYGGPNMLPAFILALSSLSVPVGMVLMLIGRVFVTEGGAR